MRFRQIAETSVRVTTAVCGVGLVKSRLVPSGRVSAAEKQPELAARDDSDTREKKLELKLVQVIFRHGARTPIHTIPKIKEAVYPPAHILNIAQHTVFRYRVCNVEGGGPRPESQYDIRHQQRILRGGSTVGTLSSLGQDQMFVLGRRLGANYIDKHQFLESSYNPEQVQLRSTNTNRTIESGRCVLAGMFGKKNLNKLKDEPVIYVTTEGKDALLPRPGFCPVLRQINHAASIHGGDIPSIAPDRVMLENIIGIDISREKKLNFIDVRDDLIARQTHGLPMPKELVPYMKMIEKNAVNLLYYAFCGQHDAERTVSIRLSAGPLLQLLFDNISDADKKSVKLYLYSSHDSTLMSLLGALDIYEEIWPPFGSDLRFELYEDDNKKEWIKVVYNGKEVVVRGCQSELCPLEEFQAAMSPYCIVGEEYYKECHSNILELIAKEMLEAEEGEIEDEDSKERSDTAAGM